MLEARAVVRELHAYKPPLAGRIGLRLDFNESTVGCSPRVLARLRSLDAELLARYPEREPVEKMVASFLGLDPAQVLLTNGVDEAIHLLCSAYLDPGDEALIVVPTFAMYAIFAQAEGARVIEVRAGNDFAFPASDLLARISSRTRLIAVANPNNPTGAAVAGDVLIKIAEAAPQAALLVDEAYFEFYGETLIGHMQISIARGRSTIFLWRGPSRKPTDLPVCASAFLRENRGRWRWFAASPRLTASMRPLSRFCPRLFRIRSTSPAMSRRCEAIARNYSRSLASRDCITGRAMQILCSSASAQRTLSLFEPCAIVESWCATGTTIPVAMVVSA